VTDTIDPCQHVWWLASRSMGVVAMALVSMSVAFGLASPASWCAARAWPRGCGPRTRRWR